MSCAEQGKSSFQSRGNADVSHKTALATSKSSLKGILGSVFQAEGKGFQIGVLGPGGVQSKGDGSVRVSPQL